MSERRERPKGIVQGELHRTSYAGREAPAYGLWVEGNARTPKRHFDPYQCFELLLVRTPASCDDQQTQRAILVGGSVALYVHGVALLPRVAEVALTIEKHCERSFKRPPGVLPCQTTECEWPKSGGATDSSSNQALIVLVAPFLYLVVSIVCLKISSEPRQANLNRWSLQSSLHPFWETCRSRPDFLISQHQGDALALVKHVE